jgi:drug/metabolite transporter (DMT)-like permease
MIGVIGGLSHILLTESYRYAPASVVAPFDYTAMLWAFLLGYAIFGEVPSIFIFVGGAVVVASGLFVIWRERQLGVERRRTSVIEGPPIGD